MKNAFLYTSDALGARTRDADGAETVQVVMIMGIFAIIVALVFLSSGGLRDQINGLAGKVGIKLEKTGDCVENAGNTNQCDTN